MMTDLLHSLRVGDELYSPICGVCKVVALDSDEIFCITVRTPYGTDFDFDRFGTKKMFATFAKLKKI